MNEMLIPGSPSDMWYRTGFEAGLKSVVKLVEKDDQGNHRVKLALPDGKTITILVPGEGHYGDWAITDGEEYGLNLVCEGHYT